MIRKSAIAPWALFAATIAGGSFLLPVASGTEHLSIVVWKGSGVALLALYCALIARTPYGWMLTAIMAFGAAGDVLLEIASLEAGAISFACGHVLATFLYWRNRRDRTTISQKMLAVLLFTITPTIAWWLTQSPGVVFYSTLLGGMAASAWISRFTRYRTGIGAIMFVASDLLIFARMGLLAGSVWTDLAIWALYFGGQLLIVLGVSKALSEGCEPSKQSLADPILRSQT